MILTRVQADLQKERDALHAEKSTWIISSATAGVASETPSQWESEKAELIRARDEASARVQVTFILSYHFRTLS